MDKIELHTFSRLKCEEFTQIRENNKKRVINRHLFSNQNNTHVALFQAFFFAVRISAACYCFSVFTTSKSFSFKIGDDVLFTRLFGVKRKLVDENLFRLQLF